MVCMYTWAAITGVAVTVAHGTDSRRYAWPSGYTRSVRARNSWHCMFGTYVDVGEG